MNEAQLSNLLREVPVPVSDAALERTVVGARGLFSPASARRAPRLAGLPRKLRLAVATGLLLLALLTPPGRAAVERVGELVGIGDVGGSPTKEPQVDGARNPVVVHAGGHGRERYEWVAYTAPGGLACVALDWPGRVKWEPGAGCQAPQGSGPKPKEASFSSYGLRGMRSQGGALSRRGGPKQDILFSGTLGAGAHGVRMWVIDEDGRRRATPVEFARIDGELLEQSGAREPFGVLVAVIDRELADDGSRFYLLGVDRPEISVQYPKGYPERCQWKAPRGPLEFEVLRGEGRTPLTVTTFRGRSAPRECQKYWVR